MKILIIAIFIMLFGVGCYYISETSIRDLRFKQSEINAKVAGLRLSVINKTKFLAELNIFSTGYEKTIKDWEGLKNKKIINLHDYYDIVDRDINVKTEINKLIVEIASEKEMIRHYERFER